MGDVTFSDAQMVELRNTFIRHGGADAGTRFDQAAGEGWHRQSFGTGDGATPTKHTPLPGSHDALIPDGRTYEQIAEAKAFGPAERPTDYNIDWRQFAEVAATPPAEFKAFEMELRGGLQAMKLPAGLGATLVEF